MKAEAAAEIIKRKPKCKKIVLNPAGCYGCEHNPLDKVDEKQAVAYQQFGWLIGFTARLSDAVSIGIIDAKTITALEFDLLRLYRQQVSAQRIF